MYAGIVLTLGAINLGSRSRVVPLRDAASPPAPPSFGYDLAGEFRDGSKDRRGQLAGSAWIDRDPVVRDLIIELATRPDGVTVESGLAMTNTESPAVTLFAGKQSLLGWPWHERPVAARSSRSASARRRSKKFYSERLPDPLEWLLHYNVKYVLWLPRDNADSNARFQPIFDKIKSRYYWHGMYGNDKDFAVGFWERNDIPAAR